MSTKDIKQAIFRIGCRITWGLFFVVCAIKIALAVISGDYGHLILTLGFSGALCATTLFMLRAVVDRRIMDFLLGLLVVYPAAIYTVLNRRQFNIQYDEASLWSHIVEMIAIHPALFTFAAILCLVVGLLAGYVGVRRLSRGLT